MSGCNCIVCNGGIRSAKCKGKVIQITRYDSTLSYAAQMEEMKLKPRTTPTSFELPTELMTEFKAALLLDNIRLKDWIEIRANTWLHERQTGKRK